MTIRGVRKKIPKTGATPLKGKTKFTLPEFDVFEKIAKANVSDSLKNFAQLTLHSVEI